MNPVLAIIAGALLGASAPEDAAPPEPPRPSLAELRPSEPAAYLRAGEDILALPGRTAEDLALARELLARAAVLAHPSDPAAAASACLALTDAAFAHEPEVERWLRSLARTLSPELTRPVWMAGAGDEDGAAAGASPSAAVALARLRNGDPRRAALVLDEPGVREALAASPELARVRGPLTVAEFFETHAQGWPCPECHGDRVESTRVGTTTVRTLCPRCSGDPGPRFDTATLVLLLRAELALTGGGSGSWAAALEPSPEAPLRAPDVADLPRRLGIDVRGNVRRDGRWVEGTGAG